MFELNEIESKLSGFERKTSEANNYIVRMEEREKVIKEKYKELMKRINSLPIEDVEKAITVLQTLSVSRSQQAADKLAELGTISLRYGLTDPEAQMNINVVGTPTRRRVEVETTFGDGKYKEDPISDNGGGVMDILSLALRIVVLNSMSDPVIQGPVILDEPFKMVSKEYIEQLSLLISNISEDFGRQVIMVTHNDYLAAMADKVVYVDNIDRKSVMEVVENVKE